MVVHCIPLHVQRCCDPWANDPSISLMRPSTSSKSAIPPCIDGQDGQDVGHTMMRSSKPPQLLRGHGSVLAPATGRRPHRRCEQRVRKGRQLQSHIQILTVSSVLYPRSNCIRLLCILEPQTLWLLKSCWPECVVKNVGGEHEADALEEGSPGYCDPEQGSDHP